MSDARFELRGRLYSLIPGPPHVDRILQSDLLDDVARYALKDVADTFDSFPGIHRIGRGRDPWSWKWRWEHDRRSIALDFSLLDPSAKPATWGGSRLDLNCEIEDLMRFWRHVLRKQPAIWLHGDDCLMFTPTTYLARIQSGI